MAAPFVLITTHRITEGRVDEFMQLSREYMDFTEQNEPRLQTHVAYLNADETEVALVQVHPDAASADDHLQLVAPRLHAAEDLFENVAIAVYGDPGPVVRSALDRNASAGVPVSVMSSSPAGFSRC